MKIVYTIFMFTIFLGSCDEINNNLKGRVFHVSEILEKKTAREIEEMDVFKVEGEMSNGLNLGFINAFYLNDVNYSKYRILINTNHTTLPAEFGEHVVLNVKLLREIKLGSNKFYLFEEI